MISKDRIGRWCSPSGRDDNVHEGEADAEMRARSNAATRQSGGAPQRRTERYAQDHGALSKVNMAFRQLAFSPYWASLR